MEKNNKTFGPQNFPELFFKSLSYCLPKELNRQKFDNMCLMISIKFLPVFFITYLPFIPLISVCFPFCFFSTSYLAIHKYVWVNTFISGFTSIMSAVHVSYTPQ